MLKKGRIFLLAAVLVLAFAQVALPALTAVGPTNPANGFPFWYRDSLGQTVELAAGDPLTIWDPVIGGNAFSAQIGFGSEAMYWTGDASIPTPLGGDPVGGSADLIMALECAFNTGDAAPGEQIVFARIRVRIDTDIAGTYTVFHPYGINTFTVDLANVGTRAINSTVDVGIGAQGDFTGALKGDVGPFLRQLAGAPVGYLGDGTFGPVTGSPINQNFFRVEGPPGFTAIQTNNLAVTGKLYTGTPYNVTRATFSRTAGAAAAEVFLHYPAPAAPGISFRAIIPGQTPAVLTRRGLDFAGRVPFTVPFTPNITVRGQTGAGKITNTPVTLKDVVLATKATYAVATQTLVIAAVSSDDQAALTATGFVGAGAGLPLAAAGADTTFSVPFPPDSVGVRSSSGGTLNIKPILLP